MRNPKRKPGVFKRLAALYEEMDRQYRESAGRASFSCAGCPQNCCVSYFEHHTYVEWDYLWRGMLTLPKDRQQHFLEKAQRNVEQCRFAFSQGLRPRIMCPLNEDGLCQLYDYRLMICRLHGVAHIAPLPDGTTTQYPGCFRYQEAIASQGPPPAPMDRTPLYRELAAIEMEHLGHKMRNVPRVRLTLSEMLVKGPAKL